MSIPIVSDFKQIAPAMLLYNQQNKLICEHKKNIELVNYKINNYRYKKAQRELKLLNEADEILKKQAVSFTEDRQKRYHEIFDTLNKMDEKSQEEETWEKERLELAIAIQQCVKNREYIGKQIPANKMITNYALPVSKD